MNSSYIPLSYAQGHRRSNISLPPYERFLHLQLAVFQKKNKQLHCQIVLYTKSSSLTSPANGKSKDGKQGNRAVRQTFFSNLNGLIKWQSHYFYAWGWYWQSIRWKICKPTKFIVYILNNYRVGCRLFQDWSFLLRWYEMASNQSLSRQNRYFLNWEQCWPKYQICYFSAFSSFNNRFPHPSPKKPLWLRGNQLNENFKCLKLVDINDIESKSG